MDLAKPSAAPPGGVEEEELDPRVQQELEKLNNCTDEINRLEIQLDDANTVFRSLLSDSTHHLKVERAFVPPLLTFLFLRPCPRESDLTLRKLVPIMRPWS